MNLQWDQVVGYHQSWFDQRKRWAFLQALIRRVCDMRICLCPPSKVVVGIGSDQKLALLELICCGHQEIRQPPITFDIWLEKSKVSVQKYIVKSRMCDVPQNVFPRAVQEGVSWWQASFTNKAIRAYRPKSLWAKKFHSWVPLSPNVNNMEERQLGGDLDALPRAIPCPNPRQPQKWSFS